MSGFCLKACSFKTLQRKSPCHPLPAQSKFPSGTSPPTKSCCPLRITVAYLASVCVSKCPARSALSSSSGCCALACPCAWLGRTCAAQPQLSASLQLPRCGGRGGGGSSLPCHLASRTATDQSAKPCPTHWWCRSEALSGMELAEQQSQQEPLSPGPHRRSPCHRSAQVADGKPTGPPPYPSLLCSLPTSLVPTVLLARQIPERPGVGAGNTTNQPGEGRAKVHIFHVLCFSRQPL